jgi:hypothetical protein
MNRIVVAFTVLTMLVLAAGAQAQSGGGYDLSWSTVDGGGQTWSTGGVYSLGGTIGQPDAGSEHGGGNYELQGGFWHAPCSPEAVAVTIGCSGNRVELNWSHDPANMAYTIHRSTSPYRAPNPSKPHDTVSSAPWEWTDAPNTCGNTATNYYYIVRSVCIGAHGDGAERAEFDFGLVPGSP